MVHAITETQATACSARCGLCFYPQLKCGSCHRVQLLLHTMPKLISTTARLLLVEKNPNLLMLYTALVFLSLHWALIIYVNSWYLGQFVQPTTISALYFLGSLISLCCFFCVPTLIQNIGNYRLALYATILEIIAVIGMGVVHTALFASLFFILHFVMMPLLLFSLDVFIEEIIGKRENSTGGTRGLYLSLLSLATAFGPLLTGHLMMTSGATLPLVYFVSVVFMLPFIYIIVQNFKTFKDPHYKNLSLARIGHVFVHDKDTRLIVLISTFLQLFFTWMVIYAPLYLINIVGFSLSEVGLIFFVGLMAYVFFEYPIGLIADKYIGEKEMMAFGFALLAIATSWYAFLAHASIGVWMCAVFVTRIGASFVEATSESYFFKHTASADADTISLFRMTRPFSSLIGAVLGGVALLYLSFNLLFIVLALLMIPGLFLTFWLKDTK